MATNTKINDREYYRIRRTIDGQVKSFYGRSKGDAEKKYKLYLETYAKEKHRIKEELDTATIDQRADEYIRNVLKVSGKYASGTIDRYEGCYRNYVKGSSVGKMVARKVRPSNVQAFYNQLDVSLSTLKAIHKFMRVFNKWMVLNGYAPDFLSAVELPKKEENKRHDEIIVWEHDEIQAILAYADSVSGSSDRHRAIFLPLVLIYTGARISEAISLRYSDFEDGYVSIERQCYRGEMKEPKYGSARRIPMHENLVGALREHRAWHQKEMKKNGYKTDYVFTTSTGNLYSASTLRKMFVRLYEKIGVPYKHFHAYRATFATQMCRCGVPMEVTSKLMGHKNLEVTAKHYALVKRDSMEDAVKMLHY